MSATAQRDQAHPRTLRDAVRVVCDGSSRGPARGGIGVVVLTAKGRREYSVPCAASDSFSAELQAVLFAAHVVAGRPALIETDNQGVAALAQALLSGQTCKAVRARRGLHGFAQALAERLRSGLVGVQFLSKESAHRKPGGAHRRAHDLAYRASGLAA